MQTEPLGPRVRDHLLQGNIALGGVRRDAAARRMLEVNNQLNLERRRRGEGELCRGVGVHYGPVIAGNIDSPSRMENTVIGDTVNLASTIQVFSERRLSS